MSSQPPRKKPRLDRATPRASKKEAKFGSSEDVVQIDILEILGHDTVNAIREAGRAKIAKFEHLSETTVDIVALSSHGEGLGVTADKDWVVVVPFCLPGERVRAKIYRNELLHSYGDLIEVLSTGASKRDDALVGCKYFGQCSGCQLQMLPYGDQLLHKRAIVSKAFQHLSGSLARV
jgi:tRNA (uracil-5-)-methyltransferase